MDSSWKRLLFTAIILAVEAVPSWSQSSTSVAPFTHSEGFFGGSSFVRLPGLSSLRSHVGLSFRTCANGTLLNQGPGFGEGNSFRLSLLENSTLRLTVQEEESIFVTDIGQSFRDNKWHDVDLRYELGQLIVTVDKLRVVVANATYNAEIINPNLLESSFPLTVGQRYVGCILEGPGVELSSGHATSARVKWGPCPIPARFDCS